VNVPQLNEQQLADFGKRLSAQFETYEKDRKPLEQQWLKNLRQYKGIYDPEIEARIPADQSKAYPKLTRVKVIGTVARLMEMLFPQSDKNWEISPTPLPELSQADLQTVLDEVTAQNPEPADEDIEHAVAEFAEKKCGRMARTMDDQLTEVDYPALARAVVFSGVLYNVGVVKGPLARKVKCRKWQRNAYTQQYEAKEIERLQPYFELMLVWNFYPDLSAKAWQQMDGAYERHVMSRNQVLELVGRSDFMGDRIKKWLREHPNGNYRERDWEQMLRSKKDRSNPTDLSGRKYEATEWWGFVTGHELKAAGVDVPQDRLHEDYEANVWLLGDEVVKAVVNPYDAKIRPHHEFIFEEDDLSLLGDGLPVVMRDSQMAVCESSRMLLDNASVVCGPNLELNTDLLVPGQDTRIHARKVWLREGQGQEAGISAVRNVQIDGHLPELMSVIELFQRFADTETALPPPAMGDTSGQGKEPYRTAAGMSMLLGAAALPIRDTVRNFDRFTQSVMSSLYHWNMQFHSDDSIKGDYLVVPRGSTSLIAKEVRAQALDQFRVTITPDEAPHIRTRSLLIERMKVRDLPVEDILEDEKVVQQNLDRQAQTLAQQQKQQAELIAAQVRELLAGAFKDVAQARKTEAQAQSVPVQTEAADAQAKAATFKAFMEGISVNEPDTEGNGAHANH